MAKLNGVGSQNCGDSKIHRNPLEGSYLHWNMEIMSIHTENFFTHYENVVAVNISVQWNRLSIHVESSKISKIFFQLEYTAFSM